ncbi:MAG: class I SAM-dependent methyltransferase [Chloroflexi bacterium]|nr:class I SAM-dependent methyltransferase [Chloroflexota bacterium]
MSKNRKVSWKTYYDKVDCRPPHKLIQKTIALFQQNAPQTQTPFAIDLGCGTGIDTVALLAAGWQVLAIDKEQEGIERLQNRVTRTPFSPQLQTKTVGFETLPSLPATQLVYASRSLPFCHPDHFDTLWAKITAAIVENGRFSGQLFGNRDSWATNPGRSHHTRAQVETLLSNFHLEHFVEKEHDGTSASGKPKHWHLFHIIARKHPP